MSEAPTPEVVEPTPKKKVRRVKKKRPSPKVWGYYKVEGNTLTRVRKECPRCGSGVFLAQHSNRESCGRCGYSRFSSTAT
jgi:small subunit ribosomal protein S27Ae